MPDFRANCAAATVLMLLVSTVGPSAAAGAELIRGITGCATSPSECPAPSDPGPLTGELPETSNLADGLPPTTTTLPGDTSVLPSSTTQTGTLSGSSAGTTGPSDTSTRSAGTTTTTNPALPPATVPALPTATDVPPTTGGGSGDSNTEGGNDGNPGGGDNGGNPGGGDGGGGGGGGTCVGNTTSPVNGTGDGTVTAAQKLGWGNPTHVENFNTGLADWGLYNSAGHGGNGLRRPDAANVAAGLLTLTGDANGKSAGMAWNCGSKYGRWEVRIKAPVSDPDYHAVALLWPDAEDWPAGGEVDFAEMSDRSRQTTQGFLHYIDSKSQEHASVDIDATKWHNWAVEWTPTDITYYVDGRQWFKTRVAAHLPPRSMHLTLQLDLFRQGGGLKPSQMLVDWAAFYPAGGSGLATSTPASRSVVSTTPPATPTADG